MTSTIRAFVLDSTQGIGNASLSICQYDTTSFVPYPRPYYNAWDATHPKRCDWSELCEPSSGPDHPSVLYLLRC